MQVGTDGPSDSYSEARLVGHKESAVCLFVYFLSRMYRLYLLVQSIYKQFIILLSCTVY